MSEIQNWNNWELKQLYEQRKLDIQKFNEQRDLEFDKKQADVFFDEETRELLKVNSYEIKQIENKLWNAKSKEFLSEIKSVEWEYNILLNEYNNNIKNLDNKENSELIKLFFEKLSVFKEKNEPLFEKIDKLDWDKLASLIEDTKYNKEKHEGFFNTFDAIWDWLLNWILLWAQKYQHIFEKMTDWNPVENITKMVNNISDMYEKMWGYDFLKLIAWNLWEDFKKIFDSEQATYKIAQSVWKLVLDIIMSLISWWVWVAWKLVKVLDKIIPDWLIKEWIKHTWNFVWEISWIKYQTFWLKNHKLKVADTPTNFLSTKSLGELWIKWEMSRLTNDLMYYWWATPYIVFNESRKVLNNALDLKKWVTKTNKELAENWYKIPSEQLISAITPDWNTVIKMVKIEKKIQPVTNLWKEAIKYLNLVEKWIEVLDTDKLHKIVVLTWNIEKYEMRIKHYEENKENESNLITELKWELEKKYRSQKS